jgi:hypothetical protein
LQQYENNGIENVVLTNIDRIEIRTTKSYLGIATKYVKDARLRVPYWVANFKNSKDWPLGIGTTEKLAVHDLIEQCESIPKKRLKNIMFGRI